jgi:fibronectin type 3 domain-containing protein
VQAYDEIPLFSIFSNIVSTTTLDVTKPYPPSGLKAIPSGTSIELDWDANPELDIEGYHVLMNDSGADSNGPFYLIATTLNSNIGYIVENLIEEVTYHFVIVAFDEVPNNSSYSVVVSSTTLDITPPRAPIDLIATAMSGTEILLNWNSSIDLDIEGYHIYINKTKQGSTGSFKLINSIFTANNSHLVSGLFEETTYYFKIKAFDEVPNNSSFSLSASAVTPDQTPPEIPTGLKVSDPTPESLKLSWIRNPEIDVIGYLIFRSTAYSGAYESLNSIPVKERYYLDTGLDDNTIYYYKIKAVDDATLQSDFSDTVSAKTLLDQYKPEINNSIADFDIFEDSYDDSSINLYHWFKDINFDELTFWVEGNEHIKVFIYKKNGTVVLVPELNWNGQETLTFYASDGNFEIWDDVVISVKAVNDPPNIPEILKPNKNTEIHEDEKLKFEGSCNDPDLVYGDIIFFSWFSNVSGKIGEGKTLRNIFLPEGNHTITLTVTDKLGISSHSTIFILVKINFNLTDYDNDNMPYGWEIEHGLDPSDGSDGVTDLDGDGLENSKEYEKGTDPKAKDTDFDGINDIDEIYKYKTDPNNPDTDDDGFNDNIDAYPNDPTKWKSEDELPDETYPEDKKSDDSTWIITGAAIALIIIVVIILFFLLIKRKKKTMIEEEPQSAAETEKQIQQQIIHQKPTQPPQQPQNFYYPPFQPPPPPQS